MDPELTPGSSVLPTILHRTGALVRDSFYRNSLLLILNYALSGLIGFVFWGVAARSFPAAEIGNVAALFSGLTFASIAAGLGFQSTVVRFLAAEGDKRAFVLATSVLVACVAAVVAVVLFLVPGHFALPVLDEASFVLRVVIGVLLVFLAVGPIADAVIIGFRASGSIVVKNVVAGVVRVLLLFFLAGSGETGLLVALLVSIMLSTGAALAIGLRRAGPRPQRLRRRPWSSSLRGKAQFSIGNYIAMLISVGPLTVLPVFVVNTLGPEQGAYLSVCLLIIIALNAVPTTVSQSLFAELAARGSEERALVLKAFRGTYSLVLPGVAVVAIVAPWVLGIYGADYASATSCLRLMAVGSIFGAFNYVADVVLNASGRIVTFTVVNVLGAVAVLVFSLSGASFGLTALGVGWLLGQACYSLIAGTALVRTGFLRRSSRSTRAVPS